LNGHNDTKMKTENNIREELKHIAPVLANVEKPENDEVPAAFFSAMNENVMSAIRLDRKAKRITTYCSIIGFSSKAR
jgi:hypothetical protein